MELNQLKQDIRRVSKPSNVSSNEWANAVNWNIEVWKCHLSGQQWNIPLEISCPEQYQLLLNEDGNSIVENVELLNFKDNYANRMWAEKLTHLVSDMREKGEWVESLNWIKLLNRVSQNQRPTPNEGLIRSKGRVKGHKLIRVNQAA